MSKLEVNRIATPKYRPHLDWTELASLRNGSEEAEKLMQWLTCCIKERRAEPFKEQ